MTDQRNNEPDFWSFLRQFGNPNQPGHGVDRPQDDDWEFDMNTFPFGPGPHGPAPGTWEQAPGGWGGFFNANGAWSPWDEHEHDHHRHRGGGRRNHEGHHGRGRHGRHSGDDEEKTPLQDNNEHQGEQDALDADMDLNEKDQSPETLGADELHSDPEEVILEDTGAGDDLDDDNGPNRGRFHQGRGHRHGRGGRWGNPAFAGPRGHGCRRGGPHGGGRGRHGPFRGPIPHHGPSPHHRHSQPPFPFPFGPFPPRGERGPGQGNHWAGMVRGFVNHPLFQAFRDQLLNGNNNTNRGAASGHSDRAAGQDDENVFVPPVDIFNTPTHYVLHIALPGAKKDDIAVNWAPDRSALKVSGIVHRPGDEELISALASSERKVGMFEREIRLPPPGVAEDDSGEVDADGISAKMEDGVLMVMVPKAEREWTEVKKVNIE